MKSLLNFVLAVLIVGVLMLRAIKASEQQAEAYQKLSEVRK